jgi:hypothetical protein
MTNLWDYLPQPTTWFSKTLNYTGIGRIEFSEPKGWVEGEISCEVNHVGEMTVVLKVQDWENSAEPNAPNSVSSRDWLISGIQVTNNLPWRMYLIPQPTNNSIVSMSLQTSNGGSLTSDHIPNYTWDPIGNTVKLYVDIATYTANGQSKINAKYWVLPCINLNLNHPFGVTESHRYTNLRQHPLRIFPVSKKTDEFLSSDAPENDKAWVQHNLMAMSYIVGFFFDGEPAFIERLPNYDQIKQELADGTARLGVTSVMIGTYSSEADEMRPVDLLPVLGLATGRPVGASWIEYRDQAANLVYRIHANLGRYTYRRGRPVVHDIIHHGGLGKLLTEASRSTTLSNSLIRGALRNSANAISGEDGTTIFYYAFTALDGLFTYYNIEQMIHPFKSSLTQSQISDIESILVQAKKDIEYLKTKIAAPSSPIGKKQSEVIDRVASKTRSQPLQKRTQFGDNLVALVSHFRFSDVDVLDTYYSNVDDWIKKVNVYRNTTMHETHYSDVFDSKTRQDFEQITPHLIDILVRVLLKTIGYTGNYAPFMQSPNSSEVLDWVQASTSPRHLGYK